MNAIIAKLKKLLASPAVHPAEVWAFRAAVAYIAVKLGITLS